MLSVGTSCKRVYRCTANFNSVHVHVSSVKVFTAKQILLMLYFLIQTPFLLFLHSVRMLQFLRLIVLLVYCLTHIYDRLFFIMSIPETVIYILY